MTIHYKTLKLYLAANEEKYRIADKIVTQGVVESHKGMSVEELDREYAKAAMFYMQYELAKELVATYEN